jgi:hypothetical protein
MNLLDIMIILVVGSLVVVGFFIGAGRVTALLAAIYLSTIISASTYDDVARSIRQGVEGMRVSSSELIAFIGLLVLFSATIYWVITFSFRMMSEHGRKFAILENAGGAALGVVVGVLTLAMTLSVTVILLGALSSAGSTDAGSLNALSRQIDNSELVPVVLKLQPSIQVTFEPWFRHGLPPILQTPPA